MPYVVVVEQGKPRGFKIMVGVVHSGVDSWEIQMSLV